MAKTLLPLQKPPRDLQLADPAGSPKWPHRCADRAPIGHLLTNGQALSDNGRNACSAGIVSRIL